MLEEIPVCNLSLFDTSNGCQFWMGSLSNLLENYPVLEEPHLQHFYSILLIQSASGEIMIDQEVVPLDQELFVIIKPGCIHKIRINKQALGCMIVFNEDFFSIRYNNNMLSQFSFLKKESKSFLRLKTALFDHFKTFTDLMNREFLSKDKQGVVALRSYLNILLVDLERNWNTGKVRMEVSPNMERIKRFERLVEERFVDKKLPSDYADLLSITPNYLNKICQKELGLTAGELIRKRVIIESQRLLHYTHLNINEISERLGFENPSYFIRFFKKSLGITPEKFRKTIG